MSISVEAANLPLCIRTLLCRRPLSGEAIQGQCKGHSRFRMNEGPDMAIIVYETSGKGGERQRMPEAECQDDVSSPEHIPVSIDE